MERQMKCEYVRRPTSARVEHSVHTQCRREEVSIHTNCRKEEDSDEMAVYVGPSLISVDEYSSRELPCLEKECSALQKVIEKIEVEVQEARLSGDRREEDDLLRQWLHLLDTRSEILQKKHRISFLQQYEHLETQYVLVQRQLRKLEAMKSGRKVNDDHSTPSDEDELISQLVVLVSRRKDLIDIEEKTWDFIMQETKRDKDLIGNLLNRKFCFDGKELSGKKSTGKRWFHGIRSKISKYS